MQYVIVMYHVQIMTYVIVMYNVQICTCVYSIWLISWWFWFLFV